MIRSMGMSALSVMALLREARQLAGLSQTELAARAGVTQSVVSVYESGRRQPSVPVLAKLIAATGHVLDLRVTASRADLTRLTGPVGRVLRRRRETAERISVAYGGHRISAPPSSCNEEVSLPFVITGSLDACL